MRRCESLSLNPNINIQNNYDLTVYSEDELKALEKMGMKKLLSDNAINEENL